MRLSKDKTARTILAADYTFFETGGVTRDIAIPDMDTNRFPTVLDAELLAGGLITPTPLGVASMPNATLHLELLLHRGTTQPIYLTTRDVAVAAHVTTQERTGGEEM